MNKLDQITVATRAHILGSASKLVDSIFQSDPLLNWMKNRGMDEDDPFDEYVAEVMRLGELEDSIQGS